jgi:hypothetical protein
MAMRPRPDLLVALAWDQSSKASFVVAADLVRPYSHDVGFSVPGFERSTTNLIDDAVVPAFDSADQVLALWSPNDPLWIGFQVGLAVGLQRPVRVVAFPGEAKAARGLPLPVTTADNGSATVLDVASGRFPSAPPVEVTRGQILLSPRATPADRKLFDLLEARLGARVFRRAEPGASGPPAVDDVVWVITEHEVMEGGHNLAPNLRNAFEAGRCYGAAIRYGLTPQLTIIRSVFVPAIVALEHLTVVVSDAAAAADLLRSPAGGSLRLTRVELRDLKCFGSISLPISTSSTLGGAWTCIAGVNGAGKSTILQSIALGLLGRSSAPELGLARLARMVRRPEGTRPSTMAEIRLTMSDGSMTGEVVLPLGERGIDERRLSSIGDRSTMEQLWDRIRSTLVVGYGATRNISDTLAWASSTQMSPAAQRLLTLFDPLGQIASTEALVAGGPRFERCCERSPSSSRSCSTSPTCPSGATSGTVGWCSNAMAPRSDHSTCPTASDLCLHCSLTSPPAGTSSIPTKSTST